MVTEKECTVIELYTQKRLQYFVCYLHLQIRHILTSLNYTDDTNTHYSLYITVKERNNKCLF